MNTKPTETPAVAIPVDLPVGPDEEWRDIPGFEGAYRVSNLGRVLSMERRCDSGGKTRRVRQRLMKHTGAPARCAVKLSRPNECSEHSNVGRLVLRAFVREPRDGEIAHYKDGDATNPRLSNMEWTTAEAVALKVGYKPPTRWKRPNAVVTGAQGPALKDDK